MRNVTIFIVGLLLILASAASSAGPEKFQKKGYIGNDAGGKCWYQQRVINESTYFHGSLTSNIGEMVFDDPNCMSDSGLGLDINKMMINNIVSRWYSHSDAKFDTKNLYKTSMAQKKGQCMQSRTYPIIGITIDYIVSDDSIVKVLHGPSLQGCKN